MKLQSGVSLLMSFCFAFFSTQTRSEEKPVFAGIVVQVDALKTNKGLVICDLYDDDTGFPNEPQRALERVKVRPVGEKAVCVFPDVKAGRYAVAIWHDVNVDQKLNSNWVGVPTEPVGVSNNAKGKFGPPKFQDAAFEYRPPLNKLNVRLE